MAFVYVAAESEVLTMRRVFGPEVTGVMFYDPDFPEDDEPWVAVAYDDGGAQIGQLSEDYVGEDEHIDALFQIPRDRGETVKFGISVT